MIPFYSGQRITAGDLVWLRAQYTTLVFWVHTDMEVSERMGRIPKEQLTIPYPIIES